MQTFEGTVTSAKSKNTVLVEISYSRKHPKYHKVLKKTTKILAHNETEGIKEGDKVEIVKSRPYSKQKHFIVNKKLEK